MWSQFKRIPEVVKSKMAAKPVELALEAIQDPLQLSDQEVPEEDESSIEALNWSDFDDEELEIAKVLAEKEFPTSTNAGIQMPSQVSDTCDEKIIDGKDESDESTQTSVVSLSVSTASQILHDLDFPERILDTEPTTVVENRADLENEDLMAASVTSNTTDQSSGISAMKEDSVSNAPVLDDGPIWGKGEKSYRFHENRKINQKLTFGVLISVVLAVGIGVGNLVAYNEYESENKVEHVNCPPSVKSPQILNKPSEVPLPTGFPSSTHIKEKVYSPLRGASYDPDANSKETLAYVVKSIDELSKKFDQFQNTTKQLSGIIVMKEEALVENLRRSRENVKVVEELDEDLMPTFNDDVSSWETSAERLLKFSDVVYEPIPYAAPAGRAFAEGQPNLISITTGRQSLPLPSANFESHKYKSGAKASNGNGGRDKFMPQHTKSKPTVVVEQATKSATNKEDQINPQPATNIEFEKPETFIKEKSLKPSGDRIKQEPSVIPDAIDKKLNYEKSQYPSQSNKKQKEKCDKDSSSADKKREKFKQNKQDHAVYENLNFYQHDQSVDNSKKKHCEEKKVAEDFMKENNEKYSKDIKREKNGKYGKEEQHKEKNSRKFSAQEFDGEFKPKKQKSRDREIDQFGEKFSNSGNNLEDFKNSKAFKNHKEGKPSKNKEHSRSSNKVNNEIKYKDHRHSDGSKKYKARDIKEDWIIKRAKAREDQRVQQNWNNDFRSEAKRKRNQNWQIERDRVREKFRKEHDD